MDKYCEEFKGGLCERSNMHVPRTWCLHRCKGQWKKGDPVNLPQKTEKINPVAPVPQQAEIQNQLGMRQYASQLLGAAKRAIKEGFACVDDKIFIERYICCTTCGGVQRCPYCGCLLKLKDRLASEKTCPNPQTYPKLEKYPPRNYWEVAEQTTTAIVTARNEKSEWLKKTVDSLFATATGKLQVFVIADGYGADPQPIDSRAEIMLHHPAVGRRVGINQAARQAKGEYLFIVDSHCRMSEGWDTRLKCACDKNTIAVARINAMAEDFEKELAGSYGFVYLDPAYIEKWHPGKPPIGPPLIEQMMGFTGCAWMIRKADYWANGGYDESLGQYGYDGPEWALKIQLDAPGKVVLRKDVICWHIFGTNTGAKTYIPSLLSSEEFSRRMAAKYPKEKISQLAERFGPLPGWAKKIINPAPEYVSIICCLSGISEQAVVDYCIRQLKDMPINKKLTIVERPAEQPPCHKTYYEQLLSGVNEARWAKYIFIAEQDCLYHPSHFAFRPENDRTFYFDRRVIWLTRRGFINDVPHRLLSMMVASRDILRNWLEWKVEQIGAGRPIAWAEPRGEDMGGLAILDYKGMQPSVDIRHSKNFTGDRKGEYAQTNEFWGRFEDMWEKLAPGTVLTKTPQQFQAQ
jgi:glycosyltransferase involved in cell wall biosynthesis